MSARSVDDLAAHFVAATLPKGEWTHVAHLMVGAWHVHHYGPADALTRLRAGIRRLNDAHGTPNSPTSGYHETITVAYVRVITRFLADCPAAMPLAERVAKLVAGPLVAKDMLFQFYSRERLMTPTARAEWVEPDLAPLP